MLPRQTFKNTIILLNNRITTFCTCTNSNFPFRLRDKDGIRIPIKLKDHNGDPPTVIERKLQTSTKKLTETIKTVKKLPLKEMLIQLNFHPKKNAIFLRNALKKAIQTAVDLFNWDESLLGIGQT